VSAIVAQLASGENVGVSCERRNGVPPHGEGGSRGVSLCERRRRRRTQSAMREQLGNWPQTIGGALIPRMPSCPVEEMP
jgi:hypothetical protein